MSMFCFFLYPVSSYGWIYEKYRAVCANHFSYVYDNLGCEKNSLLLDIMKLMFAACGS